MNPVEVNQVNQVNVKEVTENTEVNVTEVHQVDQHVHVKETTIITERLEPQQLI